MSVGGFVGSLITDSVIYSQGISCPCYLTWRDKSQSLLKNGKGLCLFYFLSSVSIFFPFLCFFYMLLVHRNMNIYIYIYIYIYNYCVCVFFILNTIGMYIMHITSFVYKCIFLVFPLVLLSIGISQISYCECWNSASGGLIEYIS